MKIKFTPGHGLAIHIDGQLAGVITKPGASISPDESGYYDCAEIMDAIFDDVRAVKPSDYGVYNMKIRNFKAFHYGITPIKAETVPLY